MNGYVAVAEAAGGGWLWRFEVLHPDGTRETLRSGEAPTEAEARGAAEAVAFRWECNEI